MNALSKCCDHFLVDVDRQSFLGAGATGRVWRAHRRVRHAVQSGDADRGDIVAGDAKRDAEIARPLALKVTDTLEKSRALGDENAMYSKYRCGILLNCPFAIVFARS